MLLDNHHGVDRRVELEAAVLQDWGLDVRVLAWDRRATATGRVAVVRGTVGEQIVRVVSPSRPGGGWSSIRACMRFAWEVWRRRSVFLDGAVVLVAHDLYVLPLGVFLARRARTPLVYDAHEDFPALERPRFGLRGTTALAHVERACAKAASLVVVPSHLREDRWREIGRPTLVLPNVGRARRPVPRRAARWDLVSVGMLSEERRIDLLLDVARARPDLQIAIAGLGRLEGLVRAAAVQSRNVQYLGWVQRPDEVLAAGAAIYYGQDPAHPYSDIACPNTLYQAIRVERPIVWRIASSQRAADPNQSGLISWAYSQRPK